MPGSSAVYQHAIRGNKFKISYLATQKIILSPFNLVAVYATILFSFLNYGDTGTDPYTGEGTRWLLITAPMLAFWSVYAILSIRIHLTTAQIYLLVYILVVGTLSLLVKNSLKEFYHLATWGIPFLILTIRKFYIDWRVVNILFLISLVAVVYLHQTGVSTYGYLPGQTIANLHEGQWWRISIWSYQTPPYSAVFCLVVALVNLQFNKSKSKFIYLTLCGYFIVFSGSKTAFVTIFMLVFVNYLVRRSGFKNTLLYKRLPLAMLILIIIIQIFPAFLGILKTQNFFLNSVIFRSEDSINIENFQSRVVIMEDHLGSWVSDVESFVLGMPEEERLKSEYYTAGTDSFITFLFLKHGLFSILFILFFANLISESVRQVEYFRYQILLIILIYGLLYGGFFNFFNAVFITMAGLIYHPHNHFYSPQTLSKL